MGGPPPKGTGGGAVVLKIKCSGGGREQRARCDALARCAFVWCGDGDENTDNSQHNAAGAALFFFLVLSFHFATSRLSHGSLVTVITVLWDARCEVGCVFRFCFFFVIFVLP